MAYLFLVRSYMLATPDARKMEFAAAVLISVLVALGARKGKRGLAFIGCGFGLIGVIGILSAIIPQRWGGGPPLEGSLAIFGSLIMLGSASRLPSSRSSRSPTITPREDDSQQT